MTFEFRRIVTGHNSDGLAVVKDDETIKAGERLPGYYATTVWCTSEFPVNNDEGAIERWKDSRPGEILLRIGEMRADQPASHAMHRTETLDYAVVLSGRCEMHLDSGEVVRNLGAGDVIIQRGTNHSWVPIGLDPCRLLFVLIPAHPAHVGEKVLREDVTGFHGLINPTKRHGA
jgi:quercetin dioxygenase-like cupin family protein